MDFSTNCATLPSCDFIYIMMRIQQTKRLRRVELLGICGTYDGSTQVLYINGLNANGQPSKTNSSASGTVYQGTAALNLGNRDNNDRHFDGDIACARMYNRALTQAEVLHNFNTQRTRFGVDPY